MSAAAILPPPPGPPTLGRLFEEANLVPMPLSLGHIPLDILRAYENWCDHLQTWLDLDAEPWLPVGAIGPLLILGHYNPGEQPALLPAWMSGRAIIREESYRKFADDLRESHKQKRVH